MCFLFRNCSTAQSTQQATNAGPSKPTASNNAEQMRKKDVQVLTGKHIMSRKGTPSPFVIEKWVAGGGFGQIFLGSNEETGQKVAIKMESMNAPQQQLYLEFGFYKQLGRGCIYVPKIHYFGTTGNWNALVMDLLGPSLIKMFNTIGKYSIACTIAVGISLLEIFRDFGDKGLIYRDIKPDNFLLGAPGTDKSLLIFMIDLGLCKAWRREDGSHIPFATDRSLTGTPLYMSVSMHQFNELSRRDDLESIMYMLIYLHTGTLPWMEADKKFPDDIMARTLEYGKIKQSLTPEELCAPMPSQFLRVFKKVRNLTFEQVPEYDDYISDFVAILSRCHISVKNFNQAYDWNASHKKRHRNIQSMSNNRSSKRTQARSRSKHSALPRSKTRSKKISNSNASRRKK